jgi:hypothetical protein
MCSDTGWRSRALAAVLAGASMLRRLLVCASLALILAGCGSAEHDTNDAGELNEADEATGEQMWVTAERIDRHTCPRSSCGTVGTLDLREAVTVVEQENGWARITHRYDAACRSGRSEFVETGSAACEPGNGIVDGQLAEWVQARFLSTARPADPAASAAADEDLVKGSDDFPRYRRAFVKAAQQLITDGECTVADFQEMSGFVKSQNHKSEPIYFTYCGGMTIANRIYVNAKTGEIYR